MNNETETQTLDLQETSDNNVASPKTVGEIVSLIANDASEEPKRYLDEVVVPDGGE